MLRLVSLAVPQRRIKHTGIVRGDTPARTVIERPVVLDRAFPEVGNGIGFAGPSLDCEGPHEEELHLERISPYVFQRDDFSKDIGASRRERQPVGEGEGEQFRRHAAGGARPARAFGANLNRPDASRLVKGKRHVRHPGHVRPVGDAVQLAFEERAPAADRRRVAVRDFVGHVLPADAPGEPHEAVGEGPGSVGFLAKADGT